ncbi:MAG: hypothetical protein ACXADF_14555 [Candidatus Thorarchaeota archaeon]|jgi:hypothetical protein
MSDPMLGVVETDLLKDLRGRELHYNVYKHKTPLNPDKPFLVQIFRGTRCLFGEYMSENDFKAFRIALFRVEEIRG